jgi:hypothetical protein
MSKKEIIEAIVGRGLCSICNEIHSAECVFSTTEKYTVAGYDVSVESNYYECPVTGYTYQTGEQVNETLAAVREGVVKGSTSEIGEIPLILTAINLSERPDRTIITDAFKAGTNSYLSNVFRYKPDTPESIVLDNLIPQWIQDYTSSLLFVVDNFDALKGNEKWFEKRLNDNDLVIDKACVVKQVKDLFQ